MTLASPLVLQAALLWNLLGRREIRIGAGQWPIGLDRHRLERADID